MPGADLAKRRGKVFFLRHLEKQGDQNKARCLSWIFMMILVLETEAETEGYDFTTNAVRQRYANRGATLASREKCPTHAVFSTSHSSPHQQDFNLGRLEAWGVVGTMEICRSGSPETLA